jgi:hypothetical protein
MDCSSEGRKVQRVRIIYSDGEVNNTGIKKKETQCITPSLGTTKSSVFW